MRTVAFYNNKGGVGKTTLAVHLALRAAGQHRLRTVAMGLDRQGDMLRWLSGGNLSIGDGSIYEHSPNLTAVYSPNQPPSVRLNADLCVIDAPPSLALDKIELALLDHAVSGTAPLDQRTLAYYLTKIAKLGGYLARAHDPPPGNMVMWRGMTRLTDIRFGAMIGARLVGN